MTHGRRMENAIANTVMNRSDVLIVVKEWMRSGSNFSKLIFAKYLIMALTRIRG